MRKLREYRERIERDPGDAEAHWRLGCLLAYLGRWDEAWPEMEWRLVGHRYAASLRSLYPGPGWAGEAGRVLVYQDQGFGDLFQYARYLSLIPDVVVDCELAAVRLLRENGVAAFPRGEAGPYDFVVPSCSLPLHLGGVRSSSGYLSAAPRFELPGGLRVGVAWAGNPDHYDDGHRSCLAGEMAGLPGRLVSLMIERGPPEFLDFSMRLGDFADTAALIMGLDVVVSVDTAVAHLAGALGKPIYLALSYDHDWRWMVERADSPWYPTVRVYRQSVRGDWVSVFRAIAADIEKKFVN